MKLKEANQIKFEFNWSKELNEICTKSKSDSNLCTNEYLWYKFQPKCPVEIIQVGLKS